MFVNPGQASLSEVNAPGNHSKTAPNAALLSDKRPPLEVNGNSPNNSFRRLMGIGRLGIKVNVDSGSELRQQPARLIEGSARRKLQMCTPRAAAVLITPGVQLWEQFRRRSNKNNLFLELLRKQLILFLLTVCSNLENEKIKNGGRRFQRKREANRQTGADLTADMLICAKRFLLLPL